MITARDLTKAFGPTRALRGVDMSVHAGEVLAVMGPSGSGKSTLLYCLAGIVRPDSGQVHFAGQRVDRLDERARTRLRRDHFGFVFQSGQLIADLTAQENVMVPLLLRGLSRAAARARAGALLERLDLSGRAASRPGEMSGGQAQRVAVARALVNAPDVVFADEPTGSLDSQSGDRVLSLLLATARAQDAAVVIVTHDARVAARADRQIVVRDGQVAEAVTA